MQVLNHKQVASLIKTIGAKRTVLVQGEAGAGKTAIAHEFRADPFFHGHHVMDPVDCTQLSDGSVWMPDIDRDAGVSRELPNERFGVHRTSQKGVEGSRPVLVCLDEIAKARQFIKDVLAPIIYERRVGQYHMPEGSVVFACTNLSDEGLGDSMLAHLRNRLIIVQMRKPTQKEWVQDFAIPRGLVPEIIAATEMFPQVFDSFQDYDAGGKYAGKPLKKDNPFISNPRDASQDQVVTPRSLHAASDIIGASKGGAFDDDTLRAALDGTVGSAFASELVSYIRFGRDIPTFTRVCEDPAGCPIPGNPVAQMVQVFQFITQAKDRDQIAAVVEYVQRMKEEMQLLFTNKVANSTHISKYVTNKMFGAMLAANRAYFV